MNTLSRLIKTQKSQRGHCHHREKKTILILGQIYPRFPQIIHSFVPFSCIAKYVAKLGCNLRVFNDLQVSCSHNFIYLSFYFLIYYPSRCSTCTWSEY